MHITLDCIPCIVTSFQRLLNTGLIHEEQKEPTMREFLQFLAQTDYQKSPPELGKEMHRMIRQLLNNPDPYYELKVAHNEKMLDLYPEFVHRVQAAKDPFDMAMRLAIAGNVIDFGPQNQLDIMQTINRVVQAQLKIDHSEMLKADLKKAKTVLYIGDNCGEIVLDKLFVETINHPNLYFAVRKSPVINDATRDDARRIGLDQIAKIVTTGDDSPGAVWETTNPEFKSLFKSADVVIAKGQGNLEGLIDVVHNIYFLLVVKCDLIGSRVSAKTGDFIVLKQEIK